MLATLADLANYLQETPEQELPKYQMYLENAEAVIISFLKYNPAVTSYQETYRFAGSVARIVLANSPVVRVAELKLNGADLTDAYLDKSRGILTFRNRPVSGFELLIDYDAGYQEIPFDIRDAVCKYVAWDSARLNAGDIGVRTKAVGESTTTFEVDIPVNIRNQLGPFVRQTLFATKPLSALVIEPRTP